MVAPSRKRRYVPVWLVLLVSTGLTTLVSASLWNWERANQRANLYSQTNNLKTALQQSLDSNLEVLQAVSGLYAASQQVQRQEFAVFVREFLGRHPSISAINWSRRLAASDRQSYEQAMRAEGFAHFQITQRVASGAIVPASQRPEYFPITYVEPASEITALGFDLGSEAMRRSTLERARDRGTISTTGLIHLVTTNQAGFLTFHPVYRSGVALDSLNARRQNFVGVATGVFQIADIVEAVLPGLQLNNLMFYLVDSSAASQSQVLLYRSKQGQWLTASANEMPATIERHAFCQNLSTCMRVLQVGDRQWHLFVLPEPGYTGLQTYGAAWMALLIGYLLTALLAIYMRLSLHHTIQVEQLVQERTTQAEQLRETLEALQKTQAQLIQTEKMSSLGQLVAGVAHEINNPINFIHGNLAYATEYVQALLNLLQLYQQRYPNPGPEITAYTKDVDLEFLMADISKLLLSMATGTERIRQIVLSLGNFSRSDQAEVKSVNIHEGIDSTLMILQNRLKATPERPAIKIIKNYSEIDEVECYVGQLNQVLMNILSNAIDALDSLAEISPGEETKNLFLTIAIHTLILDRDRVAIRIIDNGIGMTEAVQKQLFDPFFTTKSVGKGTGLGLAISYQIIVEKHKGELICKSEPGKGTEFRIEIPLHQTQTNSSCGAIASVAAASER